MQSYSRPRPFASPFLFAFALALLLALLAYPLEGQAFPSAGAPAAAAGPGSAPVRLAFSYRAGDKFRVLSEVEEEVYVNRRRQNEAEILNRIAFEIVEAAPDGSSGLLRGSFATLERPAGAASYSIAENYESEFRRDALGRMTIAPNYYMPVVRQVPTLPARELLPGDTWTAPGEERHDLRRVFGIPDPYAIPFEARYRYEGPVELEGRRLEVLTCSYTIFTTPGPPRAYASIYPIQIAGYSDQKIWWDPAIGQPAAYEERFKLVFDWSDGTTIEYRGTAGSHIVEAELMDRAAVKEEVEKAVEGLAGVSVESTEEGVAIRLEDLRFRPDSAELLPGESEKLLRVAELLKRYPERDILVGGHTALAGTAEGRARLSLDRARAVAELLISLGARRAEEIQVAGYGAERPIADNLTEEGKARNRRVEIVILEN
jgi:outer membrane protein OmpA-like peptidoglycan-associated protein